MLQGICKMHRRPTAMALIGAGAEAGGRGGGGRRGGGQRSKRSNEQIRCTKHSTANLFGQRACTARPNDAVRRGWSAHAESCDWALLSGGVSILECGVHSVWVGIEYLIKYFNVEGG